LVRKRSGVQFPITALGIEKCSSVEAAGEWSRSCCGEHKTSVNFG
jgi:hypothetical protein